jgi:hypothetical protein
MVYIPLIRVFFFFFFFLFFFIFFIFKFSHLFFFYKSTSNSYFILVPSLILMENFMKNIKKSLIANALYLDEGVGNE